MTSLFDHSATSETNTPAVQPVDDAQLPPSSGGGWSEQIEVHDNPVVHPPFKAGMRQEAGVVLSDGSDCPLAASWRHEIRISVPPTAPQPPARRLPGTWLWAGALYPHFGHFLTESTNRLWALEALPEKITGVLFMCKLPKITEFAPYHRDALKLFGLRNRVALATAPTEVERLIVPGQGAGLGEISTGTAAHQRFVSRKFAKKIKPEGPPKLYVSRTKMDLLYNGLLGEDLLESYLSAAGYEIFHPQDHDLETQIARYRAAEHIVFAEGSAIHLYAFAGNAKQRVAIVLRRSHWNEGLIDQVTGLTGTTPHVVRALDAEYSPRKPNPKRYSTLGILNLAKIGESLQSAGFVDDVSGWAALTPDELWGRLKANRVPRRYDGVVR